MSDEDWSSLRAPIGAFDRVVVLDETPSTQDEAKRLADGRPGLVVVGKRQTAGRGRQGRAWDDRGGASLSMSMVVRSGLPAAGLSLAVGLGVIEACNALGASGLGLKWPNDVVERVERNRGRKLAGVLIEMIHKVGPLAVVGVGVNVSGERLHWPPTMRQAPVSLAQLGVHRERPEVALSIVDAVSRWLDVKPETIRERWLVVGTLRGQRCVFRVDGLRVAGMVVDLDSQWRLVLETQEGSRVRIDSAQANLEEVGVVGS